MKDYIFIVKEKKSLLTLGIIILLVDIALSVHFYPEIADVTDVLMYLLLILFFAFLSGYFIAATFFHKLILHLDGVFEYWNIFCHRKFMKYDIAYVERSEDPGLIIRNAQGKRLAKVESNMVGYQEVYDWLYKENLLEIKPQYIEKHQKKEKVVAEPEYEEKLYSKKVIIAEISLFVILVIVGCFFVDSIEGVSTWFVSSSVCWYVILLLSFRKLRNVAVGWDEKNPVAKHAVRIITAEMLFVLVYYLNLGNYITDLSGKFGLISWIVFFATICIYLIVAGRGGWKKHVAPIIVLGFVAVLIVQPINNLRIKEDSVAIEYGVVEGKHTSRGHRGPRSYRVEIKMNDGNIYNFEVTKFDYDFAVKGDAVKIRKWEGVLGYECGVFWENVQ